MLMLTNRKSHSGYRLIPKLVNLNDPERRAGRYCVIMLNRALAFKAN